MKIKLYAFVYILGVLVFASSCNKKNDYSNNVEVIREWNFTLSSFNENAATSGAETKATFHMVALADSSIRYDVQIDSAVDRIGAAQIRLGDPVADGQLLLDLPVRVYNNYGSGVLTGLRPSLIDTLLNNNVEKYVNVTSGNVNLVRGQLNSLIVLSKNVKLTGSAVVPAVTTTATGTAYVRVTSNNTLYTKIVITDDPADPVTAATLNQGATGTNGTSFINLVSSASEFGTGKKTSVTSPVYSTLVSNSTYVTVSSGKNQNGKLRGQIK